MTSIREERGSRELPHPIYWLPIMARVWWGCRGKGESLQRYNLATYRSHSWGILIKIFHY
jgi:hypothetical protein